MSLGKELLHDLVKMVVIIGLVLAPFFLVGGYFFHQVMEKATTVVTEVNQQTQQQMDEIDQLMNP